MIPGISTRVTGRVSSVRCDLPSKRGKRGKTVKRTIDGDWKQSREKRSTHDEVNRKKPQSNSKTNEVELFAETEVIWGVDVGIIWGFHVGTNRSFRAIPSIQHRTISTRFTSRIAISIQSLFITSKASLISVISIRRSVRSVSWSFNTTARTILTAISPRHINISTILFTFQLTNELLIYKFPESIP